MNTNIFSLLEGGKKGHSSKSSSKKSSSKESGGSKASKKPSTTKEDNTAELEKAIFSQPAIGISNWADDSDDDYPEETVAEVEEEEDGWSKVGSWGLFTVI